MTAAFRGWWVARYAFVLAMFAWGIGFYGPAVFLQVLHTQRGWSIGVVSGAITLHFLCGAAIVWWLPELHRRFGLWPCTAGGIVCSALGALAWSMAPTPAALHGAALVSASGWALSSGATLNAIVSRWFDRDRARAIALAFNGASIGGLVFAPLWTVLIAGLGFAAAAATVGAAALLLLLPLGHAALRHGPQALGQHVDGEAVAAAGRAAASASAPTMTRSALLRDARFITLSLPFALALFAQIGLLTHLVTRLSPVLGAAGAALAVSGVTLCAVLGRSVLAGLAAGYDRRVLAALNIGVQATGALLLMLAASAPMLLLGCALFGLGFGNLTSLPPLIAQQVFRAVDVPTVVALVTALNQALFALAPASFGWLRDRTESYGVPFALALAAQLLAAALLIWGRRFDRR